MFVFLLEIENNINKKLEPEVQWRNTLIDINQTENAIIYKYF